MNDDLLPILRDRYPKLFSSLNLREIGCLPGWQGLLDGLCFALQNYLNAHDQTPQVEVLQIKEKYGGLRFYYEGGDSFCRWLVDAATERSLVTCEVCGQSGDLIGERWFSVRCPLHMVNS